ncbi:MAG TPA: site-specific DNA-methyltransferase [Pseudomonadales bacterium]|nr:site-specific DNA-methyltransferase [Pseudomonadales bacterium]
MKGIADSSVDMILCDLPYGTTACKWDSVIPFEPLWEQYRRVAKRNAAIVLTASQPFTTALIASNMREFKYEIIWDKVNRNTGFGNASFMPLKRHENVCVFVQAGRPTYNPQYGKGEPYVAKRSGRIAPVYDGGGLHPKDGRSDGRRHPVSILEIKADVKTEMGIHPTQKPVALMEYLIRTYTNDGETVLDNTMGSGTTGVACVNTGRNFIGIELDDAYFQIAKERIRKAMANVQLDNDL